MVASSTPLVSVLVTARDNERHVGVALESVLRQTVKSLELHVVDDGSRDATPAIIGSLRDERLRSRCYEQSIGICSRRNELLEAVRGRYVAPLDADDVWLPDRLERHVQLLDSRPDLVAVGSDVLVVDAGVEVGSYLRLPRSDVAIRWCCLFASPLIHSAATIRASAFHAGVRYDPAFPLAQDYDLWTQLLRQGRAENLAAPLTLYRVHPAQATQQRASDRRAEQETIGCRAIELYGGLSASRARLAWCLGADDTVADHELDQAIDAYRELCARFETEHQGGPGRREMRRIAAATLLRRGGRAIGRPAWLLRRAAVAIDPGATLSAAAVKASNRVAAHRYRGPVAQLLGDLAGT